MTRKRSDAEVQVAELLTTARVIKDTARRRELKERYQSVIDVGGPTVVLQPIVDMGTGRRIGVEALSRFPSYWNQAPDVCFSEAHSVGMGNALEILALRRAGEIFDCVHGYVAMNVSPEALLAPECAVVLAAMPLKRLVLELSEHAPVLDYTAALAVLAPLRAAGMRLAIDDVGAGFSSLRHVVLTTPDLIKIDRSLVTGVGRDPVLSTLVTSLVTLGHGYGCQVVAEGVETPEDAVALAALGVDSGQGWHFGYPGPASELGEPTPATSAMSFPSPRSLPQARRPVTAASSQLIANRLWGQQLWLHHEEETAPPG